MKIAMSGYHDVGAPCGVPVRMDLSAFPPPSEYVDGSYPGATARERCENVRAERFALSGAVAALTAAGLLVIWLWRRTLWRSHFHDPQAGRSLLDDPRPG